MVLMVLMVHLRFSAKERSLDTAFNFRRQLKILKILEDFRMLMLHGGIRNFLTEN